jgi:hypothetical protein
MLLLVATFTPSPAEGGIMSVMYSSPSLEREFDEHTELWEMIFHTQATIATRAVPGYEIRRLMRELGDKLLTHFDHEEAPDGCFGEALLRAPRFGLKASALLREHFDLLLQFFGAEYQAVQLREELASSWDTVERHLNAFVDRFVAHEAAETDLLHAAYCEDLGCGE